MMTMQQMFDVMVSHMKAQGHKAVSNGRCAYRGDDGSKCAVGALIKDEYYSEGIEGLGVGRLALRQGGSWPLGKALSQSLGMDILSRGHERTLAMLSDMQDVHDTAANWDAGGLSVIAILRLKEVAKFYGLTFDDSEPPKVKMEPIVFETHPAPSAFLSVNEWHPVEPKKVANKKVLEPA